MKHLDKIKDLFKEESFEEKLDFETQMLALNFLHSIEKEAEKQGLNKKELAEKVGKSPSYITQLFRATKVPNLKILTALGLVLGKQFDVQAVDDIQSHRRSYTNDYNIIGERFDSNKVLKGFDLNKEKDLLSINIACERSSDTNERPSAICQA